MAPDGTDVRQITVAPSDERHPDWSPDGAKIAYESGAEDQAEIYVINADGTGVVRLTNNAFGDRAPQFSHGGTKIAYMTNQRGKWEIAIMAYPGGQQLQIFDCPAPDCRFPSWAADDSFLAYNTLDSDGNVAEIWELNMATGVSNVLVPGSDKGRPNYSGDGQFCYFNATIDGNTDLYRININSLAIQRLTISSNSEYAPDWGPG
jgi:TolB protein